jgi:hypothetical protein
MRNSRTLGLAIMVLGLILVLDGARQEPAQWLRVIAGALLFLAGVLRFMRARSATPPTV